MTINKLWISVGFLLFSCTILSVSGQGVKKTSVPSDKTTGVKSGSVKNPGGSSLLSEKNKGETKIEWEEPISEKSSSGVSQSILTFKGSITLPMTLMPVYKTRLKAGTHQNPEAFFTETYYETLTESELKCVNISSLPEQIKINATSVMEKKKPYVLVDFIPLRKNPTSGKAEKLSSFTLRLKEGSRPALQNGRSQRAFTYAANSVLSQGNWFKIGVTENGVYKMDYTFLKNLGLDVDNIDPRNIRVYGNGGKMLSFSNADPRLDDLNEIAILADGESDGKLDTDDKIIFYGEGPDKWKKDNSCTGFSHENHLFTDTTYYFITADAGPGKRMLSRLSSSDPASRFSSSFDDYVFYETDANNVVKSGRQFFAEKFEVVNTYTFPFNFPNVDLNAPAYMKVQVAARSNPSATFNISCQSGSLTISPPPVQLQPYYANPVTISSGCTSFTPGSSLFNVKVDFIKNPSFNDGYGYLDYIELKVRRLLKLNGNLLAFRDASVYGPGLVVEYTLGDASSATRILNLEDPFNPVIISGVLNGNQLTFRERNDTLIPYFAYNTGSNAEKTPAVFGMVPNQNLHGLGPADMLMVSHPLFYAQAERLAELHRNKDGFRIHLVTPQMIYNEFSGGNQDVTAIKHFTKMFYDRASVQADMPGFLLLVGDGSYITQNRNTSGNTNFIPCYESANGVSYIDSYVSDDYFGLLDDQEGEGLAEQIDLAVGRIPVKTAEEARDVVDKIYAYYLLEPLSSSVPYCGNGSTISTGDWRNTVCFVADDEDSNLHLIQADGMANFVDTTYHEIDVDKIYFDSFLQQSGAGGKTYPDAKRALNLRVNRGALLINYTGHGGETGWAQERVLEISDIEGWTNGNKMPVFVTATCEFSRYDDPARTSAGEEVILRPNGGGIALLTTTRLAYASFNEIINRNFIYTVFERDTITGEHLRLGEVCRIAKNLTASSSTANHRNFAMLGDPALQLNFPRHTTITTQLESKPLVIGTCDTLKALSKITIKGFVADRFSGNKLSGFNGIIYPTVFDKSNTLRTLANDVPGSSPYLFKLRKGIIYKGKVSVTNGDFSFTFVVPKDIDYSFGPGRISYYASNGSYDANGYNEQFIAGGTNQNAPPDQSGPEVNLYMNDDKFISGSITDENPDLFAKLFDENGINTVGNGIGHDLVAVLDENTEKSVVLNDYYQSDLNSYQSGVVRYPFSKLAEGPHTLSLRAWDVYNNSSSGTIDFIVTTSADLALQHVFNYPNPFTTQTRFMFEHNKPCETLDVNIQIFTVSGKLVKTIESYIKCEGYRSESISWDGLDDYGDRIGKGVYVYRLKVTAPDGKWADKYEKLVVLR